MSRFMSTTPRTREQAKRMDQISPGVYLSVQKALENVWFGEPMAIDKACDEVRRGTDHDVYDDMVREKIAEYINLLIRVLIFDPESPNLMLLIEGKKQYLTDVIIKGRAELEPLRQRVAELEKVLTPLQHEVYGMD